MSKSLNYTCQNSQLEDESINAECQKLKIELETLNKRFQSLKITSQNDQSLLKNRKLQLDMAERNIEDLKRKILQMQSIHDQLRKKLHNRIQQNPEVNRLKAELQALRNQTNRTVKDLTQKLVKNQIKQQELALTIDLLEQENKQLRIELKNQVQNRETTFNSVLPQESIIKPSGQTTTRPAKQRVLLEICKADLINQNNILKFQIQELKQKMKFKEQSSAKRINGYEKSIQNMNSTKKPLAIKRRQQLLQSSPFQSQQSKISDKNDSYQVPSFQRANKEFFVSLQNYYKTLSQRQTGAFLNALSFYADLKLDSQVEVNQIYEFEQTY